MIASLIPSTALTLFEQLAPFGPTAEVDALLFATEPPLALDPYLTVLHTGVRAAVSDRPWWGCDGSTGHVRPLSINQRIPAGIALLTVQGDSIWDRIHPEARIDHPQLFLM